MGKKNQSLQETLYGAENDRNQRSRSSGNYPQLIKVLDLFVNLCLTL